MENWWIYVIVVVAIIAIYLIAALIIKLFMNGAQKKCFALLDGIAPKERERFEHILNTKNTMENDGRHLPKNLVETTSETEKEFQKVPVDIAKVKGMDDFLILYYRKYLKEKRLLDKYGELDKKLEEVSYMDIEDKNSIYYAYNKAALKYNAYLNMGFLNLFRGNAPKAPTL